MKIGTQELVEFAGKLSSSVRWNPKIKFPLWSSSNFYSVPSDTEVSKFHNLPRGDPASRQKSAYLDPL